MSDEFQKASIKEILAKLGIPAPKSNRCKCPIHGGDSPNSFSISSCGLLWKCQSNEDCGGGDGLVLIQKIKNCDNTEAMKLYREWFGSRTTPYKAKQSTNKKPASSSLDPIKEFKKFLKEEASSYLESRKLTFEECPLYMWPKGLTEDIAKKHGFENIYYSLKASAGYKDIPAHEAYLVLPYFNELGDLVTVQGRYPGTPPNGVPKTKFYKDSVKSYSFFKPKNKHYTTIVICEGIFEAATVNKCLDDSSILVVAAPDKSAPFGEYLNLFLETHEIVFMPDNDRSNDPKKDRQGLKGFTKLARELVKLGHDNVKIAENYTDHKDYNEILQLDGLNVCSSVINKVLSRKYKVQTTENRPIIDIKYKQAIDGDKLKAIVIDVLNNRPFKVYPKRLPKEITDQKNDLHEDDYKKVIMNYYNSIEEKLWPNLKRILKRCKFNKFSQIIEYNTCYENGQISANNWLVDLKYELALMGFSIKDAVLKETASYLDIWTSYNSYNPYDYLHNERLDKTGSIEMCPDLRKLLTNHFHFENTENALLVLDFWLSHMWFMAVRANYDYIKTKGFACHAVPVIWGDMGLQKSNLVDILSFKPLETQYIARLADKNDKELPIKQLGKLVGFYDEFEPKEHQLEHFKAFVTNGYIRYRPVYSPKYFESPRTDVLIATANESKHHIDSTGDRRIWPLKLVSRGEELLPSDKDIITKNIASFYYNKVKRAIDRLDGDINLFFHSYLIKKYDQILHHMSSSGAWSENKASQPYIEHMQSYFAAVKYYLVNKQYDDYQPTKTKDNGDSYAVSGSPIFEVRKKLKNKAYKGVFKAEYLEYCKYINFDYRQYERQISFSFVDQAKKACFNELKMSRVGDEYANYPIKTYKIKIEDLKVNDYEDNDYEDNDYDSLPDEVPASPPTPPPQVVAKPISDEQAKLAFDTPAKKVDKVEEKLPVKKLKPPDSLKYLTKDDDDIIF